MLRGNSHGLFSSEETSDNDCEVGRRRDGPDVSCMCQVTPCPLYSEAHVSSSVVQCELCGRNPVVMTRYSEGYGTEEECVLSDPQGESDADADIEDTDCRLQEPGTLQRISSRRRKRQRVARQDTTESEDDGGRSHGSHRWNLRLSPDRSQSRTILEESISQVRPLVIKQDKQVEPAKTSQEPLVSAWVPPLSSPLVLLFLLVLAAAIASFLLTWVRT
ncbi:uncharacterized protein si:ch211-63p21.1 isoform X2 [Dunckerocampus dactyliophorus]|uniref:uncharacterized protein si:ch211-63p21.1 isoform X2 n=1 Tax=Dunckerocampus dactyliophorus TaxID=161453 RepID=UPI0024056E52|nr:uncharacterized protein si:ch211-63p21.1 isoform X2 [Dunckerocampus dactyliophorus]